MGDGSQTIDTERHWSSIASSGISSLKVNGKELNDDGTFDVGEFKKESNLEDSSNPHELVQELFERGMKRRYGEEEMKRWKPHVARLRQGELYFIGSKDYDCF